MKSTKTQKPAPAKNNTVLLLYPNDNKIKALLRVRGIKHCDMARKLGMDKGQFSRVIKGYKNITLETIKKLCIFLKCSPNDVLNWENWESDFYQIYNKLHGKQ